MLNKTLKIFIKNPEIGKVKTRLAASVGDEQALSIYQKLLNYTKEVALKVDATKEVWYSQWIDEEDLWGDEFFAKKIQVGNELGDRMKQAFQEAFSKDEHAHVILIGSDCAELETDHIKNAFEELKKVDIVIGPAKDGGYYLIGMSKFTPEIFDGINWSTSLVFDQTIEKVNELDASYSLLKSLNDVDTIKDWNRIKGKILGND